MPRTKETKGRLLSRVMLTVLSAAIIAASIFIPAARAENPPMTVVYALDSANLTFRDSDAANIDQINYAFALIRDGEAVGSHWAAIDRVRAYLRKHPHIRGVMAVGGWGAEGFSDACATADGRARLADSILRLMDENGFRGFRLIKQLHHLTHIMTVNRSKICQSHILEQHSRNKKLFDAAFGLSHGIYQCGADFRNFLQRLCHSHLHPCVSFRSPQGTQISRHSSHISGNRHIVIINDNDKIRL